MKKNLFFAAVAAVAMLASCSKEANSIDNSVAAPARITIDLTTVETRNFDDVNKTSDDADTKVNDLIVFVTRTDGSFDVSPIYVAGSVIDAENKFSVKATTKAEKIYIVTNTGALATGPFKAVTNLNDVKAAVLKSDGTGGNAGSNIRNGNVWMSGESTGMTNGDPVTETIDGQQVQITSKNASIQLYYIPAKVFVVVKNAMKNYAGGLGNTKLTGVTFTNVGAWSGFINTESQAITDAIRPDYRVSRNVAAQFPYYFNGIAVDANFGDYDDEPTQVNTQDDFMIEDDFIRTTGFTALQAGTDTVPVTNEADLTEADAVYVLPVQLNGLGNQEKVWASIYGTYDADGPAGTDETAEQRFWSVAFGGGDQIADEIKSGRKYILTLEMRGDANIDTGDEDPTIETQDMYLNVELKPAAWVVSNPTKIFN
jgi:hypothetical protein